MGRSNAATAATRATATPRTRRWVAPEEAGGLLGISATTLRRWSDAGYVDTFVTPGGHRRFDVASVEALLPGTRPRPTMERLGETTDRLSRVYRRSGSGRSIAWIGALDDAQRDAFRARGRALANQVLASLDAATEGDRDAHLAAASELAALYGTAAAARRVPMSLAVETFLLFRRPFLTELATVMRRRALDTATVTGLIGRASDAFDRLLVSTMRGYEEAAAPTDSAARPSAGTHGPGEGPARSAASPEERRSPEANDG
jgi:hypothetical protein